MPGADPILTTVYRDFNTGQAKIPRRWRRRFFTGELFGTTLKILYICIGKSRKKGTEAFPSSILYHGERSDNQRFRTKSDNPAGV